MDTCSICLEDDIEELIQLDCLCDVKYCLKCISKWFNNNEEDICPICKEVVDVRYSDNYQIKKIYNSYYYIVIKDNYIITITEYKTFNISCLSNIVYIKVNDIYNEIINDMIINFLTKIKKPSLIDSNVYLKCINYNNDSSIFYQNKSLVIKLYYIEFDTINKKYYPCFKIIEIA